MKLASRHVCAQRYMIKFLLDLTFIIASGIGSRAGREVIQAYLEPPAAGPGRPVRVLAAFTVVTAAPGEHAEGRLTVPARVFDRYDEAAGGWVRPSGEFTVRIGRSSADLPLHLRVKADDYRQGAGKPQPEPRGVTGAIARRRGGC